MSSCTGDRPILVSPDGSPVGVNPNGHSVPMMWCFMDGRSWVCPIRAKLNLMFNRGVEWTVYTDIDAQVAYETLAKALASPLDEVEIRRNQVRLAKLIAHCSDRKLKLPAEATVKAA